MRVICLLFIATVAAGAARAEDRVQPSPKQADAELARPLPDPFVVRTGKGRSRQVKTCRDFLALDRTRLDTEDPLDFGPLLYTGSHCEVLARLRKARPAQTSFLLDFQLDARAPASLPPDLAITLSNGEARKVTAAREKGLSWKAYDPKLRARPGARGVLKVTTEGMEMTLTEYGRGDFDGDGLEDILIGRNGGPTEGTYADHSVFVLTRTAPGAPLKVVELVLLAG